MESRIHGRSRAAPGKDRFGCTEETFGEASQKRGGSSRRGRITHHTTFEDEMRKLVAFGASMVLLLQAAAADAQMTYNWHTGARTEAKRLRAGERIDISVTGLNPLCYATHIRVAAVKADEDISSFTQSLTPTGRRSSGAGEDSPARPPTHSPPPSPAPPPPPPPPPPAAPAAPPSSLVQTTAFDEAKARLEDAQASLDRARNRLSSVDRAVESSAEFTRVMESPPCHLGRAWNVQDFAARWRASPTVRGELHSARSWLLEAEADLQVVTTDLSRAGAISLAGEEREIRNDRAQTLRARLRAAEARLRDLQERQREEAARLQRHVATLDGLATSTTAKTSIRPGHDVERLTLTVEATPLPDRNATPVQSDTLEESLHRRFRVFVTTGAFVTFMRQHDYERVNRPVVRDSVVDGVVTSVARDSTYSTFANRNGGPLDALSPALQVNVSGLNFLSAYSGIATFGVAARTVGGTTLPEPFTGVALGLNDRIVLSGGVHFGRNEVLLLTRPGEAPEDVERRPVPPTITTADAIGVRWIARPYLTISVRP